MSKIIENMDMNEMQKQIFDAGFACLPVSDAILLFSITEADFNEHYKTYYTKGISFARLFALKKLIDVSGDSVSSLMEYMDFRKSVDQTIVGIDTFSRAMGNVETPPMTTAEVIANLKTLPPQD